MELKAEQEAMLQAAKDARLRDIMVHQVNIVNYRLAISDIKQNHTGDADMTAFSDQLEGLLDSSIVEQRKEKIMLHAITAQLEGL